MRKQFFKILLAYLLCLVSSIKLFAQNKEIPKLQASFLQAFDQKKYNEAIANFDKGLAIDKEAFEPYTVKYATAYAAMGDYAKASNVINQIIQNENSPTFLKEKAKALVAFCNYGLQHPRDYRILVQNIGDSVNTSSSEYFPFVNLQDNVLLFMRRTNYQREDFFKSNISGNRFTKAVPLSDTLNFTEKKGSPSLSADMQTLYFSADYGRQGFGRYDIYKATKTKTSWSIPKNLGRNINTDFWESAPSISSDGKALYFCSNMPGGYGGIDIYVAYKNPKGYWEEAVNLGPSINTTGDEQSPFIHADNRTLYFSSNGWPGYGGTDLFMSRRKLDSNWTTPLNLGYPINTFDNEASIAVTARGEDGYMASDRADSKGGLDIYKVILSPETRANKTYYLKGQICDASTLQNLSGTVQLLDPTDNQKIMQVNVDSSGYFVLALPYFDSLGLQVNSKDHEFASMIMSADSLQKLAGSSFDFILAEIKKEFRKDFSLVTFDINSAKIKRGTTVELDALVDYLNNSPKANVLIEGHTDNKGDEQLNKQLSSKRALAITQYMINKGIEASRLKTIGYGSAKPIADNSSELGRAKNRRTSFVITLP